jgi:hypothetical protein
VHYQSINSERQDNSIAIVYFPKGSLIVQRDTISASYEQIVLATNPQNAIIYFDTGSVMNAVSASTLYITASYALNAGSIATGAGIGGIEFFTASATWTVPAGITKVRVIAVGGGGPCGNGGSAGGQGGGGGGGYAEGVVSVAGLSTVSVVVGAGGLFSSTNPNLGTTGSMSGVLSITASGGLPPSAQNIGGVGGTGIGGAVNRNGQPGDAVGLGATAGFGGVAGNPYNFWPTGSVNEPTSRVASYSLPYTYGHGGDWQLNGNSGSVTLYW